MIIAKNEQAITFFHKKEKILVSEYKGRANPKLAIEHLKVVSNFYSKNEVKGSIVDVSKVFGSFAKVLDYLGKEGFPNALKGGLCCLCYVVPNDDLIIQNLGDRLKFAASSYSIDVNVVKTREEAEFWVNLNLKTRSKSS